MWLILLQIKASSLKRLLHQVNSSGFTPVIRLNVLGAFGFGCCLIEVSESTYKVRIVKLELMCHVTT